MGISSSWFCTLLALIFSSSSRAAKTKWDVVLPQTAAIQDITIDNEQYSLRRLEPRESLYRPDFNPKLAEGCIVDCDSEIYCHGEVLHDIEMARVYPDSKTFVDKKLLYSEETIVSKYRTLKKQTNNFPTIAQLKTFVDENFADDSFDSWTPPDFNPTPSLVNNIADEAYRKWALELNQIWKDLAQKVSEDVLVNPDRHSFLYIPNGFIKAGGRFREMYYWDSYWIIRGLLLCDMFDTARGIIENLLYLVKQYGHMPNANRKYYLQRSQPPLLVQMAATYHSASKNDKFIEDNIQYFDLEFQYWYTNRTVDVQVGGETHKLARYNAATCTPRPESYYEDFTLAANVADEAEKRKLYTGLKSAAEAGWDFSSRSLRAPDGSNTGTLLNTETQNLVFVELNCILQANAVVLSEWYRFFGNTDKSQYYKSIANKLLVAIDKVLWNEEVGIWLDYDLNLGTHRNYFYPTNLTPLWTGSYAKKARYAERAIRYLQSQGIIKFNLNPTYFGVPNSKVNTSEQWDFPNCWAPLQSIVIQGLERTGYPVARYVSFKMAQAWIHTTYTGFIEHGYMFERYSAVKLGTTGSGGEYEADKGFGWTNGFNMELLSTWGRYLKSEETQKSKPEMNIFKNPKK